MYTVIGYTGDFDDETVVVGSFRDIEKARERAVDAFVDYTHPYTMMTIVNRDGVQVDEVSF